MIKKTIYKILLLYLTISAISMIHVKDDRDTNKQTEVIIEQNNEEFPTIELIESIDELKTYINGHITFDDLKISLQENTNINDEYRIYTEEFIDLVSIEFPNIDLTLFNENLKIFQVKEIELEEMHSDKMNKEAFYRIKETAIYMHDEHYSEEIKKYCYFHELWHMFNNIYIQKNNTIYYKNTTLYVNNGTAMDEGMTTFLTEKIYNFPTISSYPKQYDVVSILYEIYGEELLNRYFSSGVEGIEKLIIENSNYTKASMLFELMTKELNGELDDAYPIYEILIEQCNNNTNYYNISKILKNISYSKNEKEPILDLFYDSVNISQFNDNTQVTFNNNEYYNINDLFYIEIENTGDFYLVNDEILIKYLEFGYIRNIYDEEDIYLGKYRVLSRDIFDKYLKLNCIKYEYDEINNVITFDKEIIRGVSYVKSK